MKKLVFAAAAALIAAGSAEAAGMGCSGPSCSQPGPYAGGGILYKAFARQPLPAFQAAPWYLYWPYNAHFMTPAPLQGAFYAPPTAAGGMHNPYFPGGYGR